MTGNKLAAFGERYRDQPLIRGLIQLVPLGVGSAIDTAVTTKLAVYEEERLRAFFDELSLGSGELSPEVVESENFLHAFVATTAAAARTRRREKIRVLARLLRGSFEDGGPQVDEYEELLSIVEELSHRELILLALLAEAERQADVREADSDLQPANKAWPIFEASALERLGMQAEDLAPALVRLQRSGCYAEIAGAYWDYTGGRGHLTRLFHRLNAVVGSVDGS